MSAYIKLLLQRHATAGSSAPSQLQQRFMEWYIELPEVVRNRPYSMTELERALGTQGKYISPVLLALGWQRRRRWSAQGHYHRYWVPPGLC